MPEITESDFKPRLIGLEEKKPGLGRRAFGLIKFTLGVCLLPFVYAQSIIFLKELSGIKTSLEGYFWSGVTSLLIIYLFIWEPAIIYQKGHKLLEGVFNFFRPLVKVAPNLLPVYTIVVLLLSMLLSLVSKSDWLIPYTVFLFGFTISLHLIFSAKSIRSRKNDFLKSNYLFGFSFIYIINLSLLAFCLSLVLKDFSFIRFFNNSFLVAKHIFYVLFKQLFLR